MNIPLSVVFHHMTPTPELERMIQNKAQKLDRFCDHIISCNVIIDVPHQHHQRGNQYQVRLDIRVPGDELAISREAGEHVEAKELPVAVRDAFDAATRLLEEYIRRRRKEVKHHEPKSEAKVRTLVADQDFGFLETADGRQLYFHKNSMLNDKFEDLKVGTLVTFLEELGDKGPQATSVRTTGPVHQE